MPETPARDHLYTIYAATRSGGLWKTTNAGTTWTPISDSVGVGRGRRRRASRRPIRNIVWMGTGDQANARSSYSGKGVFKSTDAGATWQFMGLPDSHHIARIVIHPDQPGRRLRRGDRPSLLAERRARRVPHDGRRQDVEEGALRQRRRRRDRPRHQPQDAGDALRGDVRQGPASRGRSSRADPESGIYRTDDGGDKWTRLAGGLPTGKIGRIGLDIYQKNPLILYALLENQNPDEPARRRPRDVSAISPLARRHHRQRAVSHRRWRQDVAAR